MERLQHLAHQQDKEIDETTQHLKDLKENRDRISRELSEAKHVPAAYSTCTHVVCVLPGMDFDIPHCWLELVFCFPSPLAITKQQCSVAMFIYW